MVKLLTAPHEKKKGNLKWKAWLICTDILLDNKDPKRKPKIHFVFLNILCRKKSVSVSSFFALMRPRNIVQLVENMLIITVLQNPLVQHNFWPAREIKDIKYFAKKVKSCTMATSGKLRAINHQKWSDVIWLKMWQEFQDVAFKSNQCLDIKNIRTISDNPEIR